jgi:hypothetical protein
MRSTCAAAGAGKEAHATEKPPSAIEESPEPEGLLGFVTRAAPGQSRIFEDPARGTVRVTMGRQYYSADAVICRRFTLAPLGRGAINETETRAVCREAQGWRLNPIGSTGALPLGR